MAHLVESVHCKRLKYERSVQNLVRLVWFVRVLIFVSRPHLLNPRRKSSRGGYCFDKQYEMLKELQRSTIGPLE